MRKIEQAMRDAAYHFYAWRNANTEVKVSINECTGAPVCRVYLHGNHIANVNQVAHDKMELQVMTDTLSRWPSNTTISRLRALGADVTVRDHRVYLNSKYVCER